MAKSPEDIRSAQSRQERKGESWVSFSTLLQELDVTLSQGNIKRVAEGYRERRIAYLMKRDHTTRETAEGFTKDDYIHIEQRGRTCFIEFSPLARAHLEHDLDRLQKRYGVDLLTRPAENQLRRRGYRPSSTFIRKAEWIEPSAKLFREQKADVLKDQKWANDEIAAKVENYIYRFPTVVMDEDGNLDLKLRYWYSREAYDDFLTLAKKVERGGWPKLLGLDEDNSTHAQIQHMRARQSRFEDKMR